jgi:hypothetical protein
MKAGYMIVVAATVFAVLAIARPSWSACCEEGCGNPVWISCTASAICTGGFCAPPLGSAIQFDLAATCGEGAFANCPATEAGQCADGVNNDAWTGNTLTDCADPACATDPHCKAPAPAMSRTVLMLMLVLLCMSGVAVLRRRRS